MRRNSIPASLYRKILSTVPILTVDVVIVHRGKFLLIKRACPPAKNAWWTPGGRVFWGEKMETAVQRKARSETGISVKVDKFLDIVDFKFQKGMWGIPVHTPSAFYLGHPVSRAPKIKFDKTSLDARWFEHIPKRCHRGLARMLRKAGFK